MNAKKFEETMIKVGYGLILITGIMVVYSITSHGITAVSLEF